jgi:hypothetical protein
MAALRHFYRLQGEHLWGKYGFYDAFNLDQNWTAPSYLAIDQGPIVAMIENNRTGLPWSLFMANPEILPALDAIGFQPDFTNIELIDAQNNDFTVNISPNQCKVGDVIQIEVTTKKGLFLDGFLVDSTNRMLKNLFKKETYHESFFVEEINTNQLVAGVYFVRVGIVGGDYIVKKVVVQ